MKSLIVFMNEKEQLNPQPIRLNLAYRTQFQESLAHKKLSHRTFALLSYPIYATEFLFP